MARQCASVYALMEKVAYQLKYDKFGRHDKSIARNIALFKVHASRTAQYIAIESSQIFGGRSFVKGGRGAVVEEFYRMIRAGAIAAGSEEIMLELATTQAKL
ncbi:hypothetical protein RFI_03007 [Reticulomyxa filosa]|uniref:Acyl-CoA dehydrogenase/oxidase C-terminal domain-containing protein n=1 Tax=Reticulomyxa filosa TaxID=46433 RepID=X6P7I7_RETFI|nr:hypothetical protein RFI_03007 [Reticulomyxa filosa]|eukprot:ETO34083.1 hypothetical protein RFI_03007 [Reticulomyxa filosa]